MGDGRKGYAEEAPYDAIHVGAAASTLHQEVSKNPFSPESTLFFEQFIRIHFCSIFLSFPIHLTVFQGIT